MTYQTYKCRGENCEYTFLGDAIHICPQCSSVDFEIIQVKKIVDEIPDKPVQKIETPQDANVFNEHHCGVKRLIERNKP